MVEKVANSLEYDVANDVIKEEDEFEDEIVRLAGQSAKSPLG